MGERDQNYYFPSASLTCACTTSAGRTGRVQATDNVNNKSAWVEAGPVMVSAVTKYYHRAMRRGDIYTWDCLSAAQAGYLLAD